MPFGPDAMWAGGPEPSPLVADFQVCPSVEVRKVPPPEWANPTATNFEPVQVTSRNCEPVTESCSATDCHGPAETGTVGAGFAVGPTVGPNVAGAVDGCAWVASDVGAAVGAEVGALVQAMNRAEVTKTETTARARPAPRIRLPSQGDGTWTKLQCAPYVQRPTRPRNPAACLHTVLDMPPETRSLRALALARRRSPLPPDLTEGIVRRAFRGDPDLFRAFLATLREPIGHADIVLRGSAVTGESYRGGDAFDANGPGTSDLDIVLVGRDALQLWIPDAFYVRWVNTIPLSDETRWVAPGLDSAREAAQALVGRPVHIQAMARWFLKLRALLQGQRHVMLMEQD